MQRYKIDIYITRDQILRNELELTPNQVDGINMSLYRLLDGRPFSIRPFLNVHDLNPFVGSSNSDYDEREPFLEFLHRVRTTDRIYPQRYYMLFKIPGSATSLVHAFDNPEYIQGILSACQWLQKDCRNNIKIFDTNGNPMTF